MTIFKVSDDTCQVDEIDIINITPEFFIGKDRKRYFRRLLGAIYFETWTEAHAHVLKLARVRVTIAGDALNKERRQLSKIERMAKRKKMSFVG